MTTKRRHSANRSQNSGNRREIALNTFASNSPKRRPSLINVRIWQTGSDGIDRPTVKGIALAVRKLPKLASSLAKAEARARELGLLEDDEEQRDEI